GPDGASRENYLLGKNRQNDSAHVARSTSAQAPQAESHATVQCRRRATSGRYALDCKSLGMWVRNHCREVPAALLSESGGALKPTEIRNVSLQCRFCHFPGANPTRLHRPATGPGAVASVGNAHRRKIDKSGTK